MYIKKLGSEIKSFFSQRPIIFPSLWHQIFKLLHIIQYIISWSVNLRIFQSLIQTIINIKITVI